MGPDLLSRVEGRLSEFKEHVEGGQSSKYKPERLRMFVFLSTTVQK